MKKFIISGIISVLVLSISYLIGNTSFPIDGENGTLLQYDKLKTILGVNHDSVPQEILLINVCYDKALIDYEEHGMPVGQYTITDREKLLNFLIKAKESDNYSYILLDVFFEKGLNSHVDSALFNTICSMRDIVIPYHNNAEIADQKLLTKASNADYTITFDETNFVHYQFLHGNIESIPLSIYRHFTGDGITQYGPFYTSHGKLCKNGITLKLPIKIDGQYIKKRNLPGDIPLNLEQNNNDPYYERSFLYLGADLLDIDSIIPVGEQIKDKLIVIGDFKEDVHETYAGLQPGSIICINAFYALMRGEHLVNWIFVLAIFALYFALSMMILHHFTFSQLVSKRAVKFMVSALSMSLIFFIISTISYVVFDIAYNFIIPSTLFTVFDFCYNLLSNLKKQ